MATNSKIKKVLPTFNSQEEEKYQDFNDFEFWSESGYVKIDKLTVGDFAADLKKVNKSMPDITAQGMRYIENELRYYYDKFRRTKMTKKTYELKYDRRAGGFFFKIIDKNGVRYEHDTTKESETELKKQGYVKVLDETTRTILESANGDKDVLYKLLKIFC